MKEKINITPSGDVLVIRTGEAEKIFYKNRLVLTGTIDSVLDFVEKRNKTFKTEECHAIFNEKDRSVIFKTNEQDEAGITVSGTLEEHPYLSELGINTQKTYTIASLINVLKLNRRFFMNRSEHASIVSALTKFQAKTETEFTNSNDFKGNVAQVKITKVQHEVPLNFKMNIPVFIGETARTFDVDIEVYPDGASLSCQLVSVDLAEAIEEIVKTVFANAAEKLKDYVIIRK